MAKFYLIRHGQTEWNAAKIQQGWLDSPLTPGGIAVAELIGQKLPSDTEVVFTSDLGRALKTAEIITRDLAKAQVLTDWRLRERGYGELVGKPLDASEKAKSFADPLASYRGTEPVATMDERLKSFVRDCSLLDVDSFVVVAHNGVLSRFGHLFDETHSHVSHDNSSIIEFDIDFANPRLAPAAVNPWRPTT